MTRALKASDILNIKGKSIYLQSTGCTSVRMEDGILAVYLAKENNIVSNPKKADLIIFTTCGVTSPVAQEGLKQIKELRKKTTAQIYVGGCMPEAEGYGGNTESNIFTFKTRELYDFFKHNHPADNLKSPTDSSYPFWVPNFKKKLQIRNGLNEISPELAMTYEYVTDGLYFVNEINPPMRLRISSGCNNNCTYCSIPRTRGRHDTTEVSILKAVIKSANAKGINRFLLVGENLGQYGSDLPIGHPGKMEFDELLRYLVKISPKISMAIRYLEPPYVVKFAETLRDLAKNGNLYFIGLPVQSGSPDVLKKMNRMANIEKYVAFLRELRQIKGLFLGTSIINGFPGETKEDHRKSLNFIRDIGFDVVSFQPFSVRKGTPAEKMPGQVSEGEKQKRYGEMQKEVSAIRRIRLKKYISNFISGKKLTVKEKKIIQAALNTD